MQVWLKTARLIELSYLLLCTHWSEGNLTSFNGNATLFCVTMNTCGMSRRADVGLQFLIWHTVQLNRSRTSPFHSTTTFTVSLTHTHTNTHTLRTSHLLALAARKWGVHDWFQTGWSVAISSLAPQQHGTLPWQEAELNQLKSSAKSIRKHWNMTQSVVDDKDSKWHILSFFQAQISMSGIQPSLSALMIISHKECRQHTHNASISPISVCAVFENKDKIVIVMEYASKGELYDYISERRKLGERETRHFFRQIVSAVHYCHKVRSQTLMRPLSLLLHIYVHMHKKKTSSANPFIQSRIFHFISQQQQG